MLHFLFFIHSHLGDAVTIRRHVCRPVGVVDDKTRLAARRLFDVAHTGVVDADVVTAYRLGKVSRDLGRFGKVAVAGLLVAVAHQHYVGAGYALGVEPVVIAIGHFVGNVLVLHVVFAAPCFVRVAAFIFADNKETIWKHAWL